MTETNNSHSLGRIGRLVRILLLFAGGCQILFGLAFTVANLGKMQAFGDTYELLDAGKHLVFDDRTGLFYPLILAAADLLQGITGISRILPVQLLQLILAYYGTYLVLKCFCPVGRSGRMVLEIASLFMVTSAPLLQLHLSGLPYSLALSLLCLQFALQKTTGSKWVIILFPILEALTLPWTGLAGLFLSALCMLFDREKKKKGNLRLLLTAALILLCVHAAANAVLLRPGNRGKMQNSAVSSLCLHMTWSKLGDNYFFWDDEIKNIFSEADSVSVTNMESQLLTEFGPRVDREYGYFGAQKVYLGMIKSILRHRTKETVADQLEDLLAYGFMPARIFANLNGYGRSQTGFDLSRMWEHSPELGRLLFLVSMYLIPIGLILSGIVFITSKKNLVDIKFGLLFAIFVTAWLMTALTAYFPFDLKRGYLLWYLMGLPAALAMVSTSEKDKRLLW